MRKIMLFVAAALLALTMAAPAFAHDVTCNSTPGHPGIRCNGDTFFNQDQFGNGFNTAFFGFPVFVDEDDLFGFNNCAVLTENLCVG